MKNRHSKTVSKRIYVTLDYASYERLKELAEKDERSISQYVKHMVHQEIKRIDSDIKQEI